MSDKGIIFSAPMVKALLDGRKSQTRRILPKRLASAYVANDNRLSDKPGLLSGMRYWNVSGVVGGRIMLEPDFLRLLPYAPGDRLYVREAWRSAEAYDDLAPSEMGGEEAVKYEADGQIETWGWSRKYDLTGRYRHARFMPRWASRLTLIVTDVRVQRLQEISRSDAIAEGLIRVPTARALAVQMGCDWGFDGDSRYGSPVSAYAALWNSLHGPEAWDANPWVCAITFETHRCNIDQMEKARG